MSNTPSVLSTRVVTGIRQETHYSSSGGESIPVAVPTFASIETIDPHWIKRRLDATPAEVLKQGIEEGHKIALFVTVNGACVMIEAEAQNFPTDALIAQLRLLSK